MPVILVRVRIARWACFLLVMFAFVIRGSPGGACENTSLGPNAKDKPVQASSDQFTWRVDLHSLGYPADNPQLQWRRGLDQFSTVDFVSEQVVAATFVTEEPVVEVQRRDDPNRARPYRLHAIFLDSATGKILKTLDWPTDNPNAGIFPRYDGSFLFFSTERIVLYSADWTPMKELPLPQLTVPHSYLAGISESPSGNVLVVRFHRDRTIQCIKLLTAKLDGSESPCSVPEEFTVSDNAMVAWNRGLDREENGRIGPLIEHSIEPFETNGTNSDVPNLKLQIRKQGGALRTLCDCGGGRPQFVNNDFIVVYGPFGFTVLNDLGSEKFTVKFEPRGPWIDSGGTSVRSSRSGERFVVEFNASVLSIGASTRLSGSLGDIPATFADRVNVYNIETERLIYTLKISKKQFKEIWGLALSPGGQKVAIDSGGVVQLYAVLPATRAVEPER